MKIWMEKNNWGNISSLNSIKQYLDALAKKGLIERENKKRGITLLDGKVETRKIPLIDSQVSCGNATTFLEDSSCNFLEVSKKLIPNFDKVFAFRCEGDSMNRADIDDGDCVIVRPEPTEIQDDDLVLANINGCGVVKKFKKNSKTISLLPQSSNPIHRPIFIHSSDEGAIVGKVLTILKN